MPKSQFQIKFLAKPDPVLRSEILLRRTSQDKTKCLKFAYLGFGFDLTFEL